MTRSDLIDSAFSKLRASIEADVKCILEPINARDREVIKKWDRLGVATTRYPFFVVKQEMG